MRTPAARYGRILVTAAAAGTITAATLGGGLAMAAPRAASLPCSASMSNSQPEDYTTTDVFVHTAARANVTTVAHYRTTNTTHHGVASTTGSATIAYYISGATPGYKVNVSVSVSSGSHRGSCSTSFTPQA